LQLIDTISVRHQNQDRHVELFVGSISALPPEQAVDVLVVSALPDDYRPTRTSLIGALDAAGVSVAKLSVDKEVDLRKFSSCWLSRRIEMEGVHFRRIRCFEPRFRSEKPEEVVGDIFRSIVPFTTGAPPISQIAMPLLATGVQRALAATMLDALADAAAQWLKQGIPLDRIKIVVRPSIDSPDLREVFARVKVRHAATDPKSKESFRYDLFVSYSQKNSAAIDALVLALRKHRPGLRIFLDRLELKPGAAWQQQIFESLEHSRKVICALSPEYLGSKICVEEFNIALLRHREAAEEVLLPIYLQTAELPAYMRIRQYADVREADPEKIEKAAALLAQQL